MMSGHFPERRRTIYFNAVASKNQRCHCSKSHLSGTPSEFKTANVIPLILPFIIFVCWGPVQHGNFLGGSELFLGNNQPTPIGTNTFSDELTLLLSIGKRHFLTIQYCKNGNYEKSYYISPCEDIGQRY